MLEDSEVEERPLKKLTPGEDIVKITRRPFWYAFYGGDDVQSILTQYENLIVKRMIEQREGSISNFAISHNKEFNLQVNARVFLGLIEHINERIDIYLIPKIRELPYYQEMSSREISEKLQGFSASIISRARARKEDEPMVEGFSEYVERISNLNT